MADIVSSCSSSSPSSSPRHQSLHLPPFIDRFGDIPEPARSDMIEASMKAMRQHLQRIIDRIHDHDLPCSACTKQLSRAVAAADAMGLQDVEVYRIMSLYLLELERPVMLRRLEYLKAKQLQEEEEERMFLFKHTQISSFDSSKDDDDDNGDGDGDGGDVLEIYD